MPYEIIMTTTLAKDWNSTQKELISLLDSKMVKFHTLTLRENIVIPNVQKLKSATKEPNKKCNNH